MQEGGGGQPPIIIKKVVAGGGHHGGAWKVAYADFVTAMMALFMVLWLMNANQEQKEAISSYFKDPKGVGDKRGSGQSGSGVGLSVRRQDMEGLAKHIQEAMNQMPDMKDLKDHVEMSITAQGLRIELLETEQGMFFQSGSPTPSKQGYEVLALIVKELNALPNHIALEGHTDSKPFRGRDTYTNWELSVDRANTARRILTENGFPSERIAEVTGFADRQLREADKPDNPSNRRISLIVMYDKTPPPDSKDETQLAEGVHGQHEQGTSPAAGTQTETAHDAQAPAQSSH